MKARSLLSRWPGLVLLLTMLGGLWVSWPVLWAEPVLRRGPAWLSGQAERQAAQALDEDWSARRAVVLPRRVVDWLVMGDLGPAVRQGCEGWLFLAEELAPHPQSQPSLQRRAQMVAQVSRLLAAQGIQLEVVVVPDKSRIEAAQLCGLPRAPQVQARYPLFIDRLRALDLPAVALDQVLAAAPGPRYWRTDTHWNEQGAQRVAQAIATHLGPARDRWGPVQTFTFTSLAPHERVGDLIRLAGLDTVPPALRPRGDLVRESRATAQAPDIGDDLLGDAPSPAVVLVGTSFSRNANFAPYLSAAMRTPVLDRAKDGAGFAGAARAYFGNDAFRLSPPKVVVWEFPERVLDAPLSEAERDWEQALGTGCLACGR